MSSRRKNQDSVFLKYKKRYFCCGKSPCGHVDTNSVFLKHRDSLERLYSGAGRAQWVGPRTQNPRVPGSIPGSCRSLLGHFLVMSGSLFHIFWDMLGDVWGYFGDGFGWVWDGFEKKFRRGRKIDFLKSAREYFSASGSSKHLFLPYSRTHLNIVRFDLFRAFS